MGDKGRCEDGPLGKLHETFRLRDGALRVYIRDPSHRPPHVHLYGKTSERRAYINLETCDVVYSAGFSAEELRYVSQYIKLRQAHLLVRFEQILRGDDEE